ncbi:hypothetical protein KC19_12G083000 [Ceratodon purpureus]|uniref:Protein transport protein SEC23 n=1 Tax=Ceratodon purpureus TaxID=3225 RepID=A0A8T0G5Y2_CERPU|nr:hypothetical protein KC19_12G083000 [Ceratodon purpureus]
MAQMRGQGMELELELELEQGHQHYHNHAVRSTSESGGRIASGESLLQHAHSEGLAPLAFHSHSHSHSHHGHNAGEMNGDVAYGGSGLRTAQSMPAVPMGPPPPGGDGSSFPSFLSPSQYAGPPGPPVFSNPSRPAQPAPDGRHPRGPSSFAEVPLASHLSAPLADNGHGSLGGSNQQGLLEDEFDAYSLSASAPFILFSAQKVLAEKKLMNTASLGFGALVCPGRDIVPSPPVIMHEPLRCQNCGAYVNQHCTIAPNTGFWSCTFCNKSNTSNGEYRVASIDDLRNWPELATSVVDYVDSGTRRPGFVSVSESSMSAPVVLLIDDSLDEEHLTQLQESLHTFLDSLSPATRIGIVTYGRTVAVFDLSESGVAAADVLPGDSSLSHDLKQMLIYGTGVYMAPIHVCLAIAHSIVSALRPYRGGVGEAKRERCLGTALEVVLSLIQGPATELPVGSSKRFGGRSRVLLCVGGPNTLGPGSLPHSNTHPNYAYMEKKAIKHMEHLGQEARRLDIALDVMCAGTCPARIPTLQPLADASGGVLVLHDDFGEVFCTNLQRAVRRSTGFRGILEIRCSDDVAVTRVIGPGEMARGDARLEYFRDDTSTAVRLLSVEDCQAFAITMELVDDLEDNHVYFQMVARYTSMHQAEVTRVITVRLPTTDVLSEYLQSVDDEVAAVLIAKKMVLEAKTARDAADMRALVDERIKDMAVKLGSSGAKSRLRPFPSSLSRLPELLFHLKRGPLLGSIVGHEDERAVYRNLYLQAGFELSLRMMSPRLLMHREAGTFEEVPAHDVAMQSDSVIVLDHGTDVFIWTGLRVAGDETKSAEAQAACLTLAQELTEQRFPAPRMLSFREASSQARYLQSRLIPAHKDPPYEQEARFPQLRVLTVEQRARLKSSFVPTDDPSFSEWMRRLKLTLQ